MLEDFFFGFLELLRRFVEERIYIFEFFYESFPSSRSKIFLLSFLLSKILPNLCHNIIHNWAKLDSDNCRLGFSIRRERDRKRERREGGFKV